MGQAQTYAVVADQVPRLLRLGSILEIRRRADNRHAVVGADAHGDHVLRNLLAAPNAGVEALSDDIRQAIVDDDLDFDFGIVKREPDRVLQAPLA